MLLRVAVLERIRRGEISLVFRRWRRPTVRAGGRLRTPVGVLRILAVSEVREVDISEADIAAAGCPSRAALLDGLGSRKGRLFRIAVEYAGKDPRLALRERDDLSEADVEQIVGRLRRLDAQSPVGPWTVRVLAVIRAHPRVAARTLAGRLACEKDWLKPRVRKLKELGLTVSHTSGYELSSRGRAVLRRLEPAGLM